MITVEYLRACFNHCRETGVLMWKTRPIEHFKDSHFMNAWNARYAGTRAGTINSDGYTQCHINGRNIKCHAICWALVYGEMPPSSLDHIDRNRLNNAISNLRLCTRAENSRNCVRKNTVGFKGVARSGKKFTAQICVAMKKLHLGSFNTAEEAHAAYCAAAIKHHGEFANFGAKA